MRVAAAAPIGATEAREAPSFRAIRTHPAERCRNRTAKPIPALTMLGGSIPSPCTMLIWNDLHLNVPVGNNRSNNISGRVHTGPAKLLNSMHYEVRVGSCVAC